MIRNSRELKPSDMDVLLSSVRNDNIQKMKKNEENYKIKTNFLIENGFHRFKGSNYKNDDYYYRYRLDLPDLKFNEMPFRKKKFFETKKHYEYDKTENSWKNEIDDKMDNILKKYDDKDLYSISANVNFYWNAFAKEQKHKNTAYNQLFFNINIPEKKLLKLSLDEIKNIIEEIDKDIDSIYNEFTETFKDNIIEE